MINMQCAPHSMRSAGGKTLLHNVKLRIECGAQDNSQLRINCGALAELVI